MIIIDGVVGSGKSTLAKILGEKLNIPVHFELQNEITYDLLELFYKDKKRWAFTLQVHFLNERFKMIKQIENDKGILDRSIYGDKIFASMLYEDDFMNDNEYQTYSALLNNMLEYCPKPDLLIYINCDVDTAIGRIKQRNRTMELSTPKIYWEKLNIKYDKWFFEYNLSTKLEIDANSYHPDNEKDIDNIIDMIKKINI